MSAPHSPAFAAEPSTAAEETRELGPQEVAERTDFLIESLESRQQYGTRWHRAWVAVYSIGLVVEGTRAGITDHDGARAEHLVGATKSLIALVEIYARPVRERFGADGILKMPDATEGDRLRRLEAAEQLLKDNAKLDRSRYSWLPHVVNAALNLAGGGVLLAIDEPERAAISTGLGLAFGELFIWTHPKGANADLQEYRERFGGASESRWSFGMMPGGVTLQYRF